MNISYETLTVFVFLVPGFLSSIILNSVVVRREKDNLSKILEALVFSFLIYSITSMVVGESPVLLQESIETDATKYSIHYQPSPLIFAVALAILLPLIFGASVTHDFHMRMLRKLRITTKTARDNVWLDVFTDQKRYVIVNLTDGRRLFGWPMYYSNGGEEGKLLYLYNPSWIDEEGKYIDPDMHGIFLVQKEYIQSIEFTRITAKNARTSA